MNFTYISFLVLAIAPSFLLSMNRAIDPTVPLMAINNKLITDKCVTRAFNESFDRVCDIVVSSNNLHKAGKWLKGTDLKAQINEHVNQIREYNEKVYDERDRSHREYNACLGKLPGDRDRFDEAACTLHAMNIQRVKNAHAALIRRMETLSMFIEQAQIADQRPEYFNDVQVLKQAIDHHIMWEDIKIGFQYGLYAIGIAAVGVLLHYTCQK